MDAKPKLTRAEMREDPYFKLRRQIHVSATAGNLQEAITAYEDMKRAESRVKAAPTVDVINVLLHLAAKQCKLVRRRRIAMPPALLSTPTYTCYCRPHSARVWGRGFEELRLAHAPDAS